MFVNNPNPNLRGTGIITIIIKYFSRMTASGVNTTALSPLPVSICVSSCLFCSGFILDEEKLRGFGFGQPGPDQLTDRTGLDRLQKENFPFTQDLIQP